MQINRIILFRGWDASIRLVAHQEKSSSRHLHCTDWLACRMNHIYQKRKTKARKTLLPVSHEIRPVKLGESYICKSNPVISPPYRGRKTTPAYWSALSTFPQKNDDDHHHPPVAALHSDSNGFTPVRLNLTDAQRENGTIDTEGTETRRRPEPQNSKRVSGDGGRRRPPASSASTYRRVNSIEGASRCFLVTESYW